MIPPGTPQSAKFDSPISQQNANAGTPILSTQINHYNGEPYDDGYPAGLMDGFFDDISVRNSGKLPELFKILGIYAHENRSDGDQVYLRNYGERALMRGGAWYSQQAAGLRTLCLSHKKNHVSTSVGGRHAWVD